MQYLTSIILAASLVSAAPARRSQTWTTTAVTNATGTASATANATANATAVAAAADTVLMRINIDAQTARQNKIPIGQLVLKDDAGIPDNVFALRLREDIGVSCTFNYIFEGVEKRQAQLSFGNDFQTGAPSGQVEWVDLLCVAADAADADVAEPPVLAAQPADEYRLQIDRSGQEDSLQRNFPVGETIVAGDAPFDRNTNVFALRLREDDGLTCTFKYLFEQREDRTATFTFGDDFQTAAPSGFVEFQSLICV